MKILSSVLTKRSTSSGCDGTNGFAIEGRSHFWSFGGQTFRAAGHHHCSPEPRRPDHFRFNPAVQDLLHGGWRLLAVPGQPAGLLRLEHQSFLVTRVQGWHRQQIRRLRLPLDDWMRLTWSDGYNWNHYLVLILIFKKHFCRDRSGFWNLTQICLSQ